MAPRRSAPESPAHETEKKLFNSTALNGAAPADPPPISSKPPRPQPKPRAGAAAPPSEPIRPAATVAPLSPSTPGLDRNTSRKLKQGKLKPEARIDLHGMTVARAHDALVGFILREQAAGSRCVLVITGKGGGRAERNGYDWRSNDRIGVLKSMTPQWLHAAPLGPLVVGVYPAHQRHGGEGAFYVYLRKSR